MRVNPKNNCLDYVGHLGPVLYPTQIAYKCHAEEPLNTRSAFTTRAQREVKCTDTLLPDGRSDFLNALGMIRRAREYLVSFFPQEILLGNWLLPLHYLWGPLVQFGTGGLWLSVGRQEGQTLSYILKRAMVSKVLVTWQSHYCWAFDHYAVLNLNCSRKIFSHVTIMCL